MRSSGNDRNEILHRGRPPVGKMVIFASIFGGLLLWYAHKQGNLGVVTVYYLIALFPSVILHEIAHGWVARRFGDHTAEWHGRLTLNPLRHIDPLGTVFVPATLLLLGMNAFGWARPVPVNTTGMSRERSLLVSLSGPATNAILALVAAVVLRVFGTWEPAVPIAVWQEFMFVFGICNVVLMVFNLIPIPPLDGSALLEYILPDSLRAMYMQIQRYAIFILLFIMLSGVLPLGKIFTPAIHFWQTVLVGVG